MSIMHQILFVVFSLLVMYVHSLEYKVIVDQELKVTSNDCIQDSNNTLLCATINSALKNLKNDSTVIYIRPGNYTLTDGKETDITHKQDIAIIGSGEDSIITCTENTGLGVLYSLNITIESIVMKNCGRNNFGYYEYLAANVHVALYLKHYDNVTLYNVVILDSEAVGLYLDSTYYYYYYYHDFQSNFIMNNCSIVKGSVGLVINTYGSGTILLSNTSIINNGDGSQSHDIYCSPSDAVAGIVIIESPAEIIIDSCVITNNIRGFVVYDGAVIDIYNTILVNQLNSEIVLKQYYYWCNAVHISLYGVTLSDFAIVASNRFLALNFHYSANGYSFDNKCINISVGRESHDDRDFSLQTIETNFDNCSASPPPFTRGNCSIEDYSGHCPPSYY